jgi:hypothetical protein
MARILIIILTLFVTHFTTLLSECSKLESASRAWLKRISFSQSVLICHLRSSEAVFDFEFDFLRGRS